MSYEAAMSEFQLKQKIQELEVELRSRPLTADRIQGMSSAEFAAAKRALANGTAQLAPDEGGE